MEKSKMLPTLAERLREIRAGYGLSQEKFALYLDENGIPCDCNTYKKWENGRHLPRLDTLFSLADFLCVDIAYLLDSEAPKRKEYDHVSNYTGLSPEATEKLCEPNVRRISGIERAAGFTQRNFYDREKGVLSSLIMKNRFWEILDSIAALEKVNQDKNTLFRMLSRGQSAGHSTGQDYLLDALEGIAEEKKFDTELIARRYDLCVMFSNLLGDLLEAPEE